MPIISAASDSLLVTSRSSRLGSTLPLGWLCASTTLAALARMAGLKTSRGWTSDAESVPTEIVGNSITSFLVFKSTATKFSRSRLAIRPLKRPSTSSGDDITGRPGLRTLASRLPNSTAARTMQALASPIPCTSLKSCTDAPCNPKSPPLSEITCCPSSTAVCSLLPMPNNIPNNSAAESASGPSARSRSRGLSSGGSSLMVYRRRSTLVFYIKRSFRILNDGCLVSDFRMWYSGAGEHSAGEGQGQAHDVGVIAADPLDEGACPSLDGVSSGLPHALSVTDVGFYFRRVESAQFHRGDGVADGEVFASSDGDPGIDFVGAALQEVDEPSDVLAVLRLAEDAFAGREVTQVDDGVGREHDRVRA